MRVAASRSGDLTLLVPGSGVPGSGFHVRGGAWTQKRIFLNKDGAQYSRAHIEPGTRNVEPGTLTHQLVGTTHRTRAREHLLSLRWRQIECRGDCAFQHGARVECRLQIAPFEQLAVSK